MSNPCNFYRRLLLSELLDPIHVTAWSTPELRMTVCTLLRLSPVGDAWIDMHDPVFIEIYRLKDNRPRDETHVLCKPHVSHASVHRY